MTPEHTYAMEQSDLNKSPVDDLAYPIARNNRRRPTDLKSKKTNRVTDRLVIELATNLFRRISNLKQVKAVRKTVDKMFHQGIQKKSVERRWRSVKKRFIDGSKLWKAIEESGPRKQNKGHKKARGKTKAEKAAIAADMEKLRALEPGSKFWLRKVAGDKSPPSKSEAEGHDVFSELSFPTTKSKAHIKQVPASGSRNTKTRESANGGFVLCEYLGEK